MTIIELTDEEINRCRKFAVDVVETNIEKYKKRNQFDKKKIIKDIYIGKKSEMAAYKYINNIGVDEGTYTSDGIKTGEPDFEIYGAKNKSFDADLKSQGTDNCKYHVKSMTSESAARWGLSWTFQREDPLVHTPEDTDHIVLCEAIDKYRIEIKMVMSAKEAQHLYGVPKLYKLRGIKRVLYWKDVCEYYNLDK